MGKVEYYIKGKNVHMLISPGFGAGWSTWNEPEFAYDRRIVEKYIEGINEENMKTFLDSIGYEHAYMGGYSDIKVVKVPVGMHYEIHEYDGHESITTTAMMSIAGYNGAGEINDK